MALLGATGIQLALVLVLLSLGFGALYIRTRDLRYFVGSRRALMA